jgi:PAS domain S-box-containing protein
MKRRLERAGYILDHAADGGKGLAMWRSGSYDCLLVDHDMPGKTGLEVIRELAASGTLPPVIVVTGAGNELTAVEAMKLGAADYVIKDAEGGFLDLIPSVIQKAIELKRLQTAKQLADQALAEEKQRLSVTLRSIGDAVISADNNGVVLSINRTAERLTGWPEVEAIGRPLTEVFHVVDETTREARRDHVEEILAAGRAATPIDYAILISKDGLERMVSLTGAPIFQGDVTVIGIVVVFRDITGQRRAEENLRRTNATLRTLLLAAPVGIGLVVNRYFVWTNPGFQRMTGYSAEELSGKSARTIYPDQEEFDRVGRVKYDSVRKGLISTIETRWMRKDGAILDILLSSAAIVPEDLSAGVVFTAVDITERRRAEGRQVRLATAVEQSAESILITDTNGSIVYVNPAFEKTTGYTRDEATGANPRILRSGNQDRQFYKDMWETISHGKVWRGRFINRKKDGTEYEEEATISPIFDKDGNIINYVAVKRDVTNEVRLQKQLLHAQKMEAVGTLAGGIAHDFNNLLMIILGYADIMLQRAREDDPVSKALEAIRNAALQGSDLVKRILTFSRRVETKARPIDLNDAIGRIAHVLRRTMTKMIEIDLILADNLRYVNADPAQIEQVLVNLAVNAQHAMPDGGRLAIETRNASLDERYCRARLDAVPGRYALISVTDTGRGMPKEVLDRIFEPFFTTKQDGEGAGLGLSMVHGIIQEHGGHIRCYSEPGTGTTFRIYLPALIEPALTNPEDSIQTPAFGDEGILVVDDENTIRDLCEEVLVSAGYTVMTAANGQEALATYLARQDEIDLVLLDMSMPVMGGRQCLEELRKHAPDLPVVIASGYSANGSIKDVINTPSVGFIGKPYETKRLLLAVRHALDRPRTGRSADTGR